MIHSDKRIKLTEEVGLGSWLYVILYIANNSKIGSLRKLKETYQRAHGVLYWRNACLFCKRYMNDFKWKSCEDCPLTKAELECGEDVDPECGCDEGSWYETVRVSRNPEKRIRAALNICNVFAQELKKVRDETTNQTKD